MPQLPHFLPTPAPRTIVLHWCDRASTKIHAVRIPIARPSPYAVQPPLVPTTIVARLANYHAPAPNALTRELVVVRPIPTLLPPPTPNSMWYEPAESPRSPHSQSVAPGRTRGSSPALPGEVPDLPVQFVAPGFCR